MGSMNNTIIKPLIYNSMFEVVFDNNIEVIISLINDSCGTNYNVSKDEIKIVKREIPRNNIREIN